MNKLQKIKNFNFSNKIYREHISGGSGARTVDFRGHVSLRLPLSQFCSIIMGGK